MYAVPCVNHGGVVLALTAFLNAFRFQTLCCNQRTATCAAAAAYADCSYLIPTWDGWREGGLSVCPILRFGCCNLLSSREEFPWVLTTIRTRFVLFSKKLGVDLTRTLSLGRQSLFLHPKELTHILKTFGVAVTEADASSIYEGGNLAEGVSPPADRLLKYLGADVVNLIDASAYEGATILHDMNLPVPEKYHGRYSVIIDGGTLEHIFNIPVAIENCMNLIEPGGHIIGISPSNNFLGHGFYQFSPELFFRVFSEANGFRTKIVALTEVKSRGDWYEVPDPGRD